MKSIYALTTALSAFLLFSLEPMVTRALLPQLGGSSAVWISALAFFQLSLLLGYGYTAAIASASSRRPSLWITHLALLGVAVLVLWQPQPGSLHLGLIGSPQLRLFALLSISIGLPFVILCSTAPLLQAWYARRESTAVPYRLFALSNLASLAALLAYPTVVETHLGLTTQFLCWRIGFVFYSLLTAMLTLRVRSAAPPSSLLEPGSPAPRSGRQSRGLWLALPAVASLQLAAVTAHLTQDVASLPLLWILPLGAYLLSFVLAFEFPRLYNRTLVVRLLAVLLFALGYFLAEVGSNVPIGLGIGLFTMELLLAAWFCHAELFARRPQQAKLTTTFYLYIAAGGAAGTLMVAVLSPLITDSNLDLPFAFLLTAALLLWVTWSTGWGSRALWAAGIASGLSLLFVMRGAYAHDSLLRARNFYGSLRVKQTQTPPQAFLARTLYNGNIQHGMQWFSTAYRDVPMTYYAPDSGVGLALNHGFACNRPRRIGVIGLGTGTLAAYGHTGDNLRFYEINPLVIDVAANLFTYTRRTAAMVTVVPGDARLTLAGEPPQGFDVLAVDAFSGDSIPVHLLTREALTLYRRHLAPGGVLAVHISNQYLDLAPVLARLAEDTANDAGGPLTARQIDSAPDQARGESLASWVLLTNRASLLHTAGDRRRRPSHRHRPLGTALDRPVFQPSSDSPLVWSPRVREQALAQGADQPLNAVLPGAVAARLPAGRLLPILEAQRPQALQAGHHLLRRVHKLQ